MLKITEAPALIHAGLYHLELDGRQVGTVNVFSGCLDAIRAALEETPEAAYLLEEQGSEIATLVKRLANAEMLIEKLKEEVGHWEEDFAMFDRAHEKAIALWRKEHPDAGYTPDMSDLNEWMVGRVEKAEAVKESLTSALKEICVHTAHWKTVENGMGRAFAWVWQTASTALRTAEESSVVGLIDSTPAKQPEDSANTDGDWDILNDIETNLRAKTDGMKRLLESQTLSPELAALGRELVRLAEKSLGEVTE